MQIRSSHEKPDYLTQHDTGNKLKTPTAVTLRCSTINLYAFLTYFHFSHLRLFFSHPPCVSNGSVDLVDVRDISLNIIKLIQDFFGGW